jgi:hypothetical protein
VYYTGNYDYWTYISRPRTSQPYATNILIQFLQHVQLHNLSEDFLTVNETGTDHKA